MELASHIFVVPFGVRSIILDTKRDRLLGLDAMLTRALESGREPADLFPAEEAARASAQQRLVKYGILAPTPDPVDRTVPSAPISTAWPTIKRSARIPSIPQAIAPLRALAEVEFFLRYRPFDTTLNWLRARRIRSSTVRATKDRSSVLDDFFAARPLFPVRPICRLDAMALSLLLWEAGHESRLVFGVRVQPLKAHCWVQDDQEAINEPHERLAQYTAIMAI